VFLNTDQTFKTRQIAQLELSRCVSVGYANLVMKDVGLRIRVQRDLREQFLETCRAQDKLAAQTIRKFMREHVEQHASEPPQKMRQRYHKHHRRKAAT